MSPSYLSSSLSSSLLSIGCISDLEHVPSAMHHLATIPQSFVAVAIQPSACSMTMLFTSFPLSFNFYNTTLYYLYSYISILFLDNNKKYVLARQDQADFFYYQLCRYSVEGRRGCCQILLFCIYESLRRYPFAKLAKIQSNKINKIIASVKCICYLWILQLVRR